MSSINSRLKGFGFGKRKSTASIQSPDLAQSRTPPPSGAPQIPPLFPSRPGPAPSIASTSSQQSVQMNHPGAGPRPPSYSANYPPGPGSGPVPVGRTSPLTNQGPTRTPPSQMVGGPPPINTGGQQPAGYPPPVMGGPPPPGPPGYAGAPGYPPPPPQAPGPIAPYARNSAAEVEGNSRSKAQLIVGIDFVCYFLHHFPRSISPSRRMLTIVSPRVPRSQAWLLLLLPTMRPKKILSPSGQVPVPTQSKK